MPKFRRGKNYKIPLQNKIDTINLINENILYNHITVFSNLLWVGKITMDTITSDATTILILGGLLFILIAIIGGGFSIKEITIPKIPKWMRVLSFLVGLGLIYISFFSPIPPSQPPQPTQSPQPTQPPQPTNNIIYSDYEVDTTVHNIRLLQLIATNVNNPPQVNDRITIEFTLQNVGENPIKFLNTFVVARNPFGENKDFGSSNQGKTIQPHEKINTKASIIVDNKGIWEFGPCYSLDIPEIRDENNLCPSGWRRFQVVVK